MRPDAYLKTLKIDPEVLDTCGKRLQDTATELSQAARTCGSVSLSTSAFGLMNAAMVPPITDLANDATDLIAAAGELADKVGHVAQVQAEVWQDVEQRIQDDLAAIQTALENIFAETITFPWYAVG